MNKKINNRYLIVFTVIISILLIAPLNVSAAYKKSQAANTCSTHKSSWDTACGNNYGISITATDYSRSSSYNGGGDYTNSVGDRIITITANKDAKYKIRIIKAKSEAFNFDELDINNIDDTEAEDLDDSLDLVKKSMGPGTKNPNGSATYTLKPGYEVLVIAYLASAQDSGETCKVGETTYKVKCKNGKSTDVSSGVAELTGVSASLFVENPQDETIVSNLRKRGTTFGDACTKAFEGVYQVKTNGKYKPKESSKYTLSSAEKSEYRENFYTPILGAKYCDINTVAFNLEENQIIRLSNKMLKLYRKNKEIKEKLTSSSSGIKTLDEIDREIAEISATAEVRKESDGQNTNISGLKCSDKATTMESKSYLYVKEDDIIKTREELSDGTTPEVCKVRCYEHLTLSYSPPVASKAGICFSYKVTVKSQTNCGMEYNDDLFKSDKMRALSKDMCAPVPVCSNDDTHTQAGPSEEFDSCVNQCDGGKYTQSCINKCYNKVYKKSETNSQNEAEKNTSNMSNKTEINNNINQTILDLNYDSKNDIKIERLGNEYSFTETQLKKYASDPISDCTTSNIASHIAKCTEYYHKAKLLYPRGHYNKSGSKWITNVSTTKYGSIPNSIGRASPYYLRSKTATRKLIKALLGHDEDSGRRYEIDGQGIKRLWSGKWVCSESCTYSGCSNKNALTPADFIKSFTIEDADSDDTEGATEDRKSDFDLIGDALDDCLGSAACETSEKTSEFTIKIENPRTDKKTTITNNGSTTLNSTTGSYNTITNTSGNETDGTCSSMPMFVPANDDDSTTTTGIKGLCYDGTTQNPQYKTTITFPGSWINLKTGEVKYGDCQDTNAYDKQGQKFCSAYDSTNVNEKWWNWVTNNTMTTDDDYNDATYTSGLVSNYNITASAKNFGKYNWNIGLSCFYAISSCVCEDDLCKNCKNTTTPPPDPCSGDDNSCVGNNSIRIAALGYDSNGANKLFPNNRARGFNWTATAQDKSLGTNAHGYDINPETYAKEIADKAEKVYDETPDLEIKIGPKSGSGTVAFSSFISKYKISDIGTTANGSYKTSDIDGLRPYVSNVVSDVTGTNSSSRSIGENYKR